MTIYYLDPENGNDSLNGLSFANRNKSLATIMTGTIAAGDLIKCIASPDPTLVGNATWTKGSRNITLAAAVTQTITNCESAWTASANATAIAETASGPKQGTTVAKITANTAFTTGKVAYFPLGSTVNLSAFQQVSFWYRPDVSVGANVLSLRLCSDTLGNTTVNTLPLPANDGSGWAPVTINNGSALGSAIQSIAIYADSDPSASVNTPFALDHIIACKAAGSADALTLRDLIGKVHNMPWTPTTAYSLDTKRRPRPVARNGYVYKVTVAGTSAGTEPAWPDTIGATVTDGSVTWVCEELEDTWYSIRTIEGTVVTLDYASKASAISTTPVGYAGATETVASYRRTPINIGSNQQLTKGGTAAGQVTFQGGWDRTDMSTLAGETWLCADNAGGALTPTGVSIAYATIDNISYARGNAGFSFGSNTSLGMRVQNMHYVCNNGAFNHGGSDGYMRNVHITQCFANLNSNIGGIMLSGANYSGSLDMRAVSITANNSYGIQIFNTCKSLKGRDIVIKGNSGNAIHDIMSSTGFCPKLEVNGLTTADNVTTPAIDLVDAEITLVNASIGEASEFAAQSVRRGLYIRSHNHDRTPGNHILTSDGGSIVTATDERHTGSGVSWKFRPTSTSRHAIYPLELSVAKLAVAANSLVTLTIWTRRDSTDIKGRFVVEGGQLDQLVDNIAVAEPTINTWEQCTLTFTPKETGVVEVKFKVFDGIGTTNSFWIDDFVPTQA